MSKKITKDQSEKREFLRLPRPYRVEARELVFPIAKEPVITTQSLDISTGGLCIESESNIPVGTQLIVTIHIPLLNKFSSNFFKVYENDSEQFFQAITQVAWVRHGGDRFLLGLKFVNIDETTSVAIDKLISSAFKSAEKTE